MNIAPQNIPDVCLIKPRVFDDARGWFMESYNYAQAKNSGIDVQFVQDNISFSKKAGTIRGLHFQAPPYEQAKLVRVLRGRILDVAVDIRKGSPFFGQHVAVELSAAGREQLFIPAGFAHGFCTLEDDTEVFYKVTNFYAPEHDGGIIWNDPDLGIEWPVSAQNVLLSDKDQKLPQLKDIRPVFAYEDRVRRMQA